jgi:hypothetical protein
MSALFGLQTPGHVGAEGFRDLHGEWTDASGGAVDQYPASGRYAAPALETLDREDGRLWQSLRFLIADAARGVCPGSLGSDCVLRESAVAELGQVPKHRITGLESSDVLANRLNVACCVKPEATMTGCAQPDAHASEERFAVSRCRLDSEMLRALAPAPHHP